MTTIKVMGCGGRYSAYAFCPCSCCMAANAHEGACKEILKGMGYLGKHEEWWTIR